MRSFGYHEAVVEELGDVLWYKSAIARRSGTSLTEIVSRAAGQSGYAEGVHFEAWQAAPGTEAFEASLLAKLVTPPNALQSELIATTRASSR